ncbi:Recombinase zinc beta ribbon domain-containing protein [Lentzea xinjiangensis]|uniref:Recombinase zinc beta ribbon domain-containing protein n=2 Tax=Lentzea xinjiangensis TaxID=402600 RepID=A0A1H9WQL0_9PSEU|nr:Recombinase zinc beta ribbon domain-containing protein [Lentzea xinjiangensis]
MIGTRATGKTETYRYYTCMKRLKYGKDTCDQDRLNADALDQAVLDCVASFYGNQHQLIRDAVDEARKVDESSHDKVTAELKTVRTKLTTVTAKIDKYLDAFEADTFDANDDTVKERMRAHRSHRTNHEHVRPNSSKNWRTSRLCLTPPPSPRSTTTSAPSSRRATPPNARPSQRPS